MSRLPNFFIIGAPKAGTTSLYYYLDQHPQIFMSPLKEPHFFASEIREEHFDAELRRRTSRDSRSLRIFLSGPMREKRFGGIVPDWTDYLSLFANANNESAVGEASPCYLWSRTAPEQIAGRIPDAKILVMLRDPAERAFSQYLHGVGNGAIRWSFREHIERNLRHHSGQFCVHYPFLEFGLYAEQLGRYFDRFGHSVWVGFHEDFENRPLSVYQDICRFLQVCEDFSPEMGHRHLEAEAPILNMIGQLKRRGLWQAAANVTPSGLRPLIRRALTSGRGTTSMDPRDRNYLLDFYRGDVRRLASLLGRNLDHWLEPR